MLSAFCATVDLVRPKIAPKRRQVTVYPIAASGQGNAFGCRISGVGQDSVPTERPCRDGIPTYELKLCSTRYAPNLPMRQALARANVIRCLASN